MKYSGGWSFSEAYNLPIGLRNWFTKRLVKQLEAEKEAIESASKSKGRSSTTQTLTPNNAPNLPQRFRAPDRG